MFDCLRYWRQNAGRFAGKYKTLNRSQMPQSGRFGCVAEPRFTNSTAMRVVRFSVVTIGDAIAIAVAVVTVGNAITVQIAMTAFLSMTFTVAVVIARLPSTTVQSPAIIALPPLRALIVMARAHALPMPFSPLMLFVFYIPIAGCPFISVAWSWNDLIPRRRRRIADNDTDAYLRDRFSGNKYSSADNNCCDSTENTFHTNLQTNLCAIQYI